MGFVLYEQKEGYAIVTINRPEALNALNSDVLAELDSVFDQIDTNVVRAVILTGAGVEGAEIQFMCFSRSGERRRGGIGQQ